MILLKLKKQVIFFVFEGIYSQDFRKSGKETNTKEWTEAEERRATSPNNN